MLEVPPLEQGHEEALREIAGIVGARPATADVSVERIPVGFAECCERGAGGDESPLPAATTRLHLVVSNDTGHLAGRGVPRSYLSTKRCARRFVTISAV
jgi:hypothetical protein